MKIRYLLFLIVFSFFSCQDKKSNEAPKTAPKAVNDSGYPEGLQNILDAHGGIALWKTFGAIDFNVLAGENSTSFKTNLKNRKAIVEGSDFSLGFEGRVHWTFDESPSFNDKLYTKQSGTYFSSLMPFVIIQDGAFYTERIDAELFRVNYGVIHIGFGRSSGMSSDDEYVLYYDKETHQIVWVGYRVVEQDRFKRKYWEFVRYDTFQNIAELILPQKWTVYEAKGSQPTKKVIYTVEITEMKFSEDPFAESILEGPEGSVFR